MRITMYPPPPMLPAAGHVGTSAKPTATAASTALPPRFRISTPASLASGALLAIIACGANAAFAPAGKRHAAGKLAARRSAIAGARSGAGGDAGRQASSAMPERTAERTSDLFMMRRVGKGRD